MNASTQLSKTELSTFCLYKISLFLCSNIGDRSTTMLKTVLKFQGPIKLFPLHNLSSPHPLSYQNTDILPPGIF